MRNLLLDALSAGLEELDAPPSTDVEASTLELIAHETAVSTALAREYTAVNDVRYAQQDIADLTRLAGGLEGLMIEVTNVENKDDPSSEELAALRASALTVQREFLDPEQRRLVDDIVDGRLNGSVEGLGDVIKNVSTKLTFAAGNFWSAVKRSISTSKATTASSGRLLADLVGRIGKLPDITYRGTVKGDQAYCITVDGVTDIHATLADVVPACDAWFHQQLNAKLDKITQLMGDMRAALATTTRDEFDAVTQGMVDHFAMPVVATAKKVDMYNGRQYVFDIYKTHPSFNGLVVADYVARPSHIASMNSQYYDNAAALSVSFCDMMTMKNKASVKAEVALTKADMLNGLAQLQQAVKVIDGYLNQMDMVYKTYADYLQITSNYGAFIKHSFVSKDIQAQVVMHDGAVMSVFESTFIATGVVLASIDRLAGIVKGLVYSTDLSNKE